MNYNSITIHPQRLAEYVIYLQKKCYGINSRQVEIEKEFKALGQTWYDASYVKAGQDLYEVSKSLEMVYDEMRSSVSVAREYYNLYVEAQRYKGKNLEERKIERFATTLKGGISHMDLYNKSGTTDLDAIKRFIDNLSVYINETQRNITELKREHDDVGRQKSWVAPQYKQLGNVIDEVDAKIKQQLAKLSNSNDQMLITWKILKRMSELKADKK